MARRIIVVEDFEKDAAQLEEVLANLHDRGLKAYFASSIFSAAHQPEIPPASPTEAMAETADSGVVRTLLHQKTILEDELRKYRMLLENSGDLMYAFDFGGTITYVTPNVEEFLGYKPEEVIGKNFLHFIPQQFHSDAVEQFRLVSASSNRFSFPANLLSRDGRRIPVEISSRTFYENGLPVLHIGLARDVTERRQMEAEMLKRHRELSALSTALNTNLNELRETNARLEEATRHKSEFLANMSHELRTPLNAIIGFSEILQDQGFGPLNEKQSRYVTNILSSGKNLLALVNDVLDLSKVEAGKMELDLEEFDPQEAINEVLAIVSVMALKKQIGLGVRPGDSVPTIKADRGKFRQILYNLLSNAVKFTPEGGMVEVHTRQVADRIEISVIDNGIGISPEDHERIFEEFRMLDNVLTKRTQGTGLGLALSRKLAQLHGGTIGVQSAAGQGSIFTFNLPIFPLEKGAETARQPGLKAPPPEQNSYNKDGSPEARPGEKVALVVEDDDKAAEILQLYLEQSGYRVARATTGEAVLAQAKELKPAVISLDILLPAKNGLEVLRELQADPTTRDIPVLVVSMTDNRQISFELGAVAFFAKPVYRQELTAKLQDLQLNELHQRRRKHVQHGEPLRALVIDDNPHDRELITTALTAAGLTVATAPDGETGWQMAQRNPPDLVVLDLMMPELDGFEVLSRLRQHEGTFEVPVFIYTAKELDLQERTRLDHEAEAVLQKGDFSRQTLLEAVERLTLHGD